MVEEFLIVIRQPNEDLKFKKLISAMKVLEIQRPYSPTISAARFRVIVLSPPTPTFPPRVSFTNMA